MSILNLTTLMATSHCKNSLQIDTKCWPVKLSQHWLLAAEKYKIADLKASRMLQQDENVGYFDCPMQI